MNREVVPVRTGLIADLRGRVFRPLGGPGPGARRVGVEVEFLPVVRESGAVAPLAPGHPHSSLDLLRGHGRSRGWREGTTASGGPRFFVSEGGVVSFEPGGQIEYSSPALESASELLRLVERVTGQLRQTAAERGVDLLSVGMDPWHPVECAPLRLHTPRYRRMAAYLAGIGPWGARMMRQSVALHVNLDFGDEPELAWRVLNAAAPLFTAGFANSPVYAGEPVLDRSVRARCWRELDPLRTGLFPAERPVEEYLDFALAAPFIEAEQDGAHFRPYRDLLAGGEAGSARWRDHLTTLFPEVRPKGYLEVRCFDAVAPEWLAAPVVLAAGLVYDRRARREAAELLGRPDPVLLRKAGETGLRDPVLGPLAITTFEIALAGATRLGPRFAAPGDLERAGDFLETFTRRGACPADEWEELFHRNSTTPPGSTSSHPASSSSGSETSAAPPA